MFETYLALCYLVVCLYLLLNVLGDKISDQLDEKIFMSMITVFAPITAPFLAVIIFLEILFYSKRKLL